MRGVLTLGLELWIFGSPGRLQFPTLGSVGFTLTLIPKWGCDNNVLTQHVRFCFGIWKVSTPFVTVSCMVNGSQSSTTTSSARVVLAPSLGLVDNHMWWFMLAGWRAVWLHPVTMMELSVLGIRGHCRFAYYLSIFSFGMDQWVNLRTPLRLCCWQWCECFFGHPKKWKICSYVKKGTSRNLMGSTDKVDVVPPMCLPAVLLFVSTVLVGTWLGSWFSI
jgi:hypothetical protein